MKVKVYRGRQTLQSIRNQTRITEEESLVLPAQERQMESDMSKPNKLKKLRPYDAVSSLAPALKKASYSSEPEDRYILYAIMKTDLGSVSNSHEYVNDSIRKLFNWRCNECRRNQNQDQSKPEPCGDKVVCSYCNHEVPIMWNLKCELMD